MLLDLHFAKPRTILLTKIFTIAVYVPVKQASKTLYKSVFYKKTSCILAIMTTSLFNKTTIVVIHIIVFIIM